MLTSLSSITRIGNPILGIKLPQIQRFDIQSVIQPIHLPSINIAQSFTQYSTLVNQFALTRYEIFKKSVENMSERLVYFLSKISLTNQDSKLRNLIYDYEKRLE